jgi:sugar O-acyltransferase (sialic acid O-acetyltransferase NeuD family)
MIRNAGNIVKEGHNLSAEHRFDMRIIIYGGGGHAKSVIDLIRQLHSLKILGIIDDTLSLGTIVLGIPVLGSRDILSKLLEDGVRLAANAIGGISDITRRVEIFHILSRFGYSFPILQHPKSLVEPSAVLDGAVQIFANAYVGSETLVETGCIINTGAIVSHDCVVGEYTHIAPGAILAGGVKVGARTLIGMGVTTTIGIKIGADVRIGNGALLHQDVPDKTIVQAGTIWPLTMQG